MSKFSYTDGLDREIELKPSIPLLIKLKAETGMDFASSDVERFGLSLQALADPLKTWQAITLLSGLDHGDVGQGLTNGDVIEAAQMAVLDVGIHFLPANARETVRQTLNRTQAAQDQLAAKMRELFASPEFDQVISQAVDKAFGGVADGE